MTEELFPVAPPAPREARDYQSAAIEATLESWKKNRHLIGVMGTGGGKTFIFSEIIRRVQPCRVMVLAHMDKLCDQIQEALERVGIRAEIEKAGNYARRHGWNKAGVVIATPQTLYAQKFKRLKEFDPNNFKLLVVDEAHHYVAASFRKCVQHFQQNPELKTLAVTATPNRHDNESLQHIIGAVAFDVPMKTLIDGGWLVRPRSAVATLKSYDLSECGKVAGDFNGRELANVLERDGILLSMASEIVKQTDGKRTLIFCHRVEQAEKMAVYLNNHRAGCADCVFGHTPEKDRDDIYKRFENGQLEKLVNVGVATEAYDNPNIEWVVMCRPTLSTTLYIQMLGRGTRVGDGILTPDLSQTGKVSERLEAIAASFKPCIRVLDFVGNTGRHDVIRCEDILSGNVSEEARRLAKKRIAEKGGGDVLAELAAAEIELKKRAEAVRLAGLTAKADYEIHYVDPFETIRASADKWKGFKQHHKLSEKQRALLTKGGFNPDEMSFEEAKTTLDKMFEATPGQLACLRRAGYSAEELAGLNKMDCGKLIGPVKANNWQRPTKPNGNGETH